MDTPLNTAEMAGLLDALQDPAVLLSLEYRVVAANQAYTELYGDGRPLQNRTCYEVSHGYSVPCDQAGESCPLIRCRQSGKKQRVLHLHNTSLGQEHVDVELTPIHNHQGQLVCFLEKMRQVKTAAASVSERGMVGRSAAFNQMLEMLQRAAPSEISVLLLGESGTGKELVAQAIHQASNRARHAFVTVECSGLTESLFESELFGHEKGAFTGALTRKQGLVEAARGGTLFLDEIGEVPLSLQVKLLRLIETGTYRRVGGVDPQQADFRLICATHRSLKAQVEQGLFRQDLYYRIAVFPIPLPSLAERRDDLELLISTLLKRIVGGEKMSVSPAALNRLRQYAFPGNIRELRNILERGALLADAGIIELEHLPAECLAPFKPLEAQLAIPEIIPLADVEKRYLQQVLAAFEGDYQQLAMHLQISERTLYRKLKALKEADE